jgi:hypothetical protein
MRAKLSLLTVAVVPFAISGIPGEKPVVPGWSEVRVRVVDDATGMPVPGARLQHLCTISPYYRDMFVADTNGVAKVMVFRTWVALSASGGHGLTNCVFIGGTNEVARFCTNAVISLKPAKNDSSR